MGKIGHKAKRRKKLGIRTTQHVGLSPRAREAVLGYRRIDSSETYFGMYEGDEHSLDTYVYPNDAVRALEAEIAVLQAQLGDLQRLLQMELETRIVKYTTYVQAMPWNAGPMVFLGLKDSEGHNMFGLNWTEEEIYEASR